MWRVVRMFVKQDFRRKGPAEKMLNRLEEEVIYFHGSRLVLETNRTWESAICFYKKRGFPNRTTGQ